MKKATTWEEAELKLKLLLKELRWTEEELFTGSDEEGDRGEEDHERKRKKAEEEEKDLLRSHETARKLLYADAPGVVCFPTSKFFDYSNCVAEAKRTKAARPDFKDASLDLFLSSSASASASSSSTTGDKTQLQLLAEQRDYKRRRRSYRAKNVHITKRTPIQVTRDFINKRMEELEAILLQQQHEQEQQQTKTLSNEEEPAQARNSSNRRRDIQSNQKRRREAGNEDYYHHRG
ncbi:U11 U12 small nuclear ribonucleoprotein 48 kDa [Balamuthia mandrillaris]